MSTRCIPFVMFLQVQTQILTDFWRVGSGYAKKLEANGMFTMGDVARRSVTDEGTLYKLFGINAELLIDHAWGWEPCTIAEIKAYKPSTNSISSGQVLHCPYSFEKAKLITREMLTIKKRYGKNAILKGMNFEEGATAKDRNSQIGGHKA